MTLQQPPGLPTALAGLGFTNKLHTLAWSGVFLFSAYRRRLEILSGRGR